MNKYLLGVDVASDPKVFTILRFDGYGVYTLVATGELREAGSVILEGFRGASEESFWEAAAMLHPTDGRKVEVE